MWKGPREFFTYTRKQRNGLLILAAVAVLLQVLLYFDGFWIEEKEQDYGSFRAAVAEWERSDSLAALQNHQPDSLFYFDPNAASQKELLALGFSSRLATTIHNYRSKGGSFRKPEDLLKIYTMDSSLYQKLEPYIAIAAASPEILQEEKEKTRPELHFHPFELNTVSAEELEEMGLPAWQVRRIISFREKYRPFQSKEDLYKVYDLDSAGIQKMWAYAAVEPLDSGRSAAEISKVLVNLNTADSLGLMQVRGIGPAFAHRILEYRQRLGGFVKKEQLLEVYGIDEERYRGIEEQVLVEPAVKKLDINMTSFKELLRHPYLEYEVVRNIVRFRERVRPFKTVEELKNIELIDADLFSKIAPYLKAGSQEGE